MKSPTRLAAATGAVLAAVAFGSTAALASGSSGHDDHDTTILRAGVVGSMVADPTLFGAKPGGAPWVIDEGQARVSRDGSVRVEVEGLVIPGRGNPVPQLSASVACGGMVVATTKPVAFDAQGDARIRAKVMLPERCLAPAVLLNPNGNPAVYIAVTGG
ncbi:MULTISPECIES: hypothetical protein [unclassified Phycicoccus]|uniref:hypothetical protein n=1 Tax=unclassified Phycicoccus TaxID=2637926 RepID=UPI0007026A46|nr:MULTISPECIES: hypothetical protein [unclassified Phycicoccus]KQU68578.1 hypothetical protein ASC58_07625 [Phycicoccus sp. Root101]KQZ88069.1 hypothetical protein ASD62_00780 [Phycicoccus sp. Root563]